MIEFYKYITGSMSEYLLFLFIVLVSVGSIIHFIKCIIDAIGEQVVKAIFASKSKIVLKNPINDENNQQ